MKDNNAGLVIGLAVMLLGTVLIGAPLLLGHPPLRSGGSGVTADGNQTEPKITPNTMASANLGNVPRNSTGGSSADPKLVATNNVCVGLISKGKTEEAIDLLEPLVKQNPDYGLARDNLAIAYNNQALKQVDNPKEALDSLRRSYCLSPKEVKTTENINDLLKVLHKQPASFEDRATLGDAQNAQGCLYGAYVEYSAALAVHNDPRIAQKLQDIEKQASNCHDDDINGAFYVKMALRAPTPNQKGVAVEPDFKSYMAHLQRAIKRQWFPPTKQASKRTEVMFTVAQDGTLSNVRVSKSSGEADEDKAGLDALKALGQAQPLPPGSPPSVDIQFTFDYNVFNSSKGE